MNPSELISLEEAIRKIGFVVRPIVGASMMPLLDQTCDTVRLVACTRPLRKYDIPLYKNEKGELILHRIVKVRPDHYVIRGDNTTYTEYVPLDRIIAVADGCTKDGVWHLFSEEAMICYAKKVVRWWPLKRIYRMCSASMQRFGRLFKK